MPVPKLRTRWVPSPCGRLSRPRTTTDPPPRPRAISRRRACPSSCRMHEGEGGLGAVPMFTMYRLAGSAPSCSAADSPRLRRRPSPWPPGRRHCPTSESSLPILAGRTCTAARPISTRLEPVHSLSGFKHWFTFVTPLCLARRTRAVWQCRPVPSLSGLLPTLPSASSVRLPSASSDCCDSPMRWVSHPPWLHGASWRTVSTVKKSVARMLVAWARRNSDQVGPRRGAGPSPWRRSTRRIELADRRWIPTEERTDSM